MQKLQQPQGRAYAFFQSPCTRERIVQALANMKAEPEMKLPRALGLEVVPLAKVCHGHPIVSEDAERPLLGLAILWQEKKANFFMKAVLAGQTDRQVAGIVGDIFNLLYSCTEILGPENKPVADVYFRYGNAYVSKLSLDRM